MKYSLWILAFGVLVSAGVQARPGVIAVSSETNRSAPEELRRVDAGLTYAIAVSDFTSIGSLPPRNKFPEPAVIASAVANAMPATMGRLVTLTDQPDVLLACHHGEVSSAGPQIPVAAKTGPSPTRPVSSALIVGRGFVPILTRSERDQMNAHQSDDVYFLVVTAYDGRALRDGREEVLWQTRMSVDSLRTDSNVAWSAMARAGAPHFGRDLDRPGFVRLRDVEAPEAIATSPAPLSEVLSARANKIELALF